MITILHSIFFSQVVPLLFIYFFFFFNDTATTEIYTLSLHDALPIWIRALRRPCRSGRLPRRARGPGLPAQRGRDRKSTRLNSSHQIISYAVFCLKKKKKYNLINYIQYLTNAYRVYEHSAA